MTLTFDLEKVREENNCVNYFETGLWDCDYDAISIKIALKCKFNKLYSVEIRKDWVEKGKKILENEITNNRLTIYNDDSNFIEKYLINNSDFRNKTLFFLDAHVDNVNIKNYINKCPLFNEISAIGKLDRKDHVICIDDLRLIKGNTPWGETSYGNIDWIESIKKEILKINQNYKFSYLNGEIENDILIAFV
jgi:hypothetical protein